MIWVFFFILAEGLNVKSGSLAIVESGKVEKYWKGEWNWGQMKEMFRFVEGIGEDSREFLVWDEGKRVRNIRVRVEESSLEVEVTPKILNFESFSESRFNVYYTCGDKKIDYLKILLICEDLEGVENTYTIQYLKICDNQERFIWNFGILNIFAIFIVIFALWLERPLVETATNSENLDENNSKLSNFLIGYIQIALILLTFIILLTFNQSYSTIQVMLNILSGISLTYIAKYHLPLTQTKGVISSLSLGLALVLICTFFPNILTQNLKFVILSLFALKTTKFWSFPLLASITLLVFIFYLCTLRSNLQPILSETTLLHVSGQTYPSTFAIPGKFSNSNFIFFYLSLLEVYIPGVFLIKFRLLSLPIDNKYFTFSFYTYIFSCLLESFIRGFSNTSSLFLPGPFIIIIVSIYSVYRKEFKNIFFGFKEQNLVSGEIPMKSF